jgi:hypothetical protein
MTHTYRFTAITNVVILKRDVFTAADVPVKVDEDISPNEEVTILPVTGVAGGTATLVRRTSGVNSAAVTVKRTHPRRLTTSALYSQLWNADKIAAPYYQISY